MVGTVLSVLVLYGVALLVLSVYGGTGAGHSPRLRRQVSADLARSEAGPVPHPCAAVYGLVDSTHSIRCHFRQPNAYLARFWPHRHAMVPTRTAYPHG